MKLKVSESQIQSTILDYLIRKKHFVIRLNNIPPTQMVNGSRVFRRLPKGSVKGLPDILVIWNNSPVWLEVKASKGMQSQDQRDFQKRCEEHVPAQEYHVVRRLEDIINIGL
jgi:hypothetical protein